MLLAGWALGLLLALVSPVVAADEFRLRISWGGQAARTWQGSIWISEGELSEPAPLGIEADEPGSMWLDEGQLLIRQRSPRSYDGVDLLVRAPRTARLAVQLSAAGDHPADRWIEAPIETILSEGFSAELDAKGSRLLINRRPGDLIPVQFDRQWLVFAPGERFVIEVTTSRLGAPHGARVRFMIDLKDPRAEKSIWQSEAQPLWKSETTVAAGEEPLPIEVPLDVPEGVYEVTILATQPGWLPLPQSVDASLADKRSYGLRKIQLVVVDPQRPTVPTGVLDDQTLKVVEEIDPASPRWWERLSKVPQLPRLQRLWKGPLGNQRSRVVDHPLGPLVRMEPSADKKDISWEAYTIPIKEAGKPHVLEVQYPSDHPQTLGISIIEPNAAGAAVLSSLDGGVDLFEEVVGDGQPSQWSRHRILFWPKSKTPLVLITNRREAEPALFGKIRVLEVQGPLPRAHPVGDPATARLVAAYLDRPLFPDNFSAHEVLVPPSQLGMHDWRTFYQGGTRLIEYLNHVGYGGLILSVYADGSTIYPSRLLEPTTRYDTGEFLTTGQDPVRKDVLEMVFRLFDREGLKLIPALEFAAPLPGIEALLRRGGPEAEGLVWIGPDGRSWTETHAPRAGLAPYYNVLDPRVQEAMLEVVRELVGRYSAHRSFAGLAVQLSADGFAQLPGPAWGLDDATIARFQKATGTELQTGEDRFAERARRLASPRPDPQWLAWRAEQLTAFYRQVHKEITAQRPDTRVYLAGARMFENEELKQLLRPSLPYRTTLKQAMLHVGIDPGLLAEPGGPVLLYGQTVLPRGSLNGQAVPLELERMIQSESTDNGLRAGVLFYHQPQEAVLPSFDKQSPFQPSLTRLSMESVPSGAQNRRRFVRALAQFDPLVTVDGSLRLPLGQEDALRDLVALYRRLPDAHFQRLPAASSDGPAGPVTVRYLQRPDATYVYLVNEAAFPVTARVRLDVPAGCRIEELTGMRRVAALAADEKGTYWDVELQGYDALGAWLSSPRARVQSAKARWAPSIDRALAARVADLENRHRALFRPPQWGPLQNAGFEAEVLGDGQIPGWMFPPGGGSYVQVDRTRSRSGKASLHVVGGTPASTVVSLPFPAPKTGRLTVSMWLKTNRPAAPLPMRIGIFGVVGGKSLYRSGPLLQPIGAAWSPIMFVVDDLPLEGLDELHLRLELPESGEVWADDIQLWNLSFDETEWAALIKTILPARETLAGGQIIDCIRVLEGYWPQFLIKHVPLVPETAHEVAQTPRVAADAEKPKEEPSGLLRRIRGMVPEKLRF